MSSAYFNHLSKSLLLICSFFFGGGGGYSMQVHPMNIEAGVIPWKDRQPHRPPGYIVDVYCQPLLFKPRLAQQRRQR